MVVLLLKEIREEMVFIARFGWLWAYEEMERIAHAQRVSRGFFLALSQRDADAYCCATTWVPHVEDDSNACFHLCYLNIDFEVTVSTCSATILHSI